MKTATPPKGFASIGAKIFLALWGMLLVATGYAQPANDDCANASVISITGAGYALGTFISANSNISAATVQNGESFAPAILASNIAQKSVWFKFTLPTTRSIGVTLAQPGTAITAGDVGFAVYKTTLCLPVIDSLSTKLTPIATFGITSHPCVDPGTYYVQVSGNNRANGPVYIQLSVLDTTGALYDYPSTAYDFGQLAVPNYTSHVDFPVGCQSVDNAAEVCKALSNYPRYTKSTWHTFTTPAYFDYLSVLLSATNYYGFAKGAATFGYNLYQGDAKTQPLSSLTLVNGCDSLVTAGYTAAYKLYKCNTLQPGTTYTIQLFYDSTFNDNVRLAVAFGGIAPTQAPQPILSQVPPSNNLGVVPYNPNGFATTALDYLACNSNAALHPCNPSLPGAGVNYNGTNYNLSTFFTFQLASSANINLQAFNSNCSKTPLLIRLYDQALTNNCASLDTGGHLIAQFLSSYTGLDCLLPGNYTVQVMGTDSLTPDNTNYYNLQNSSPLCLYSNLGDQVNFYLVVASVKALDTFALNNPNAYNAINYAAGKMQPLQNGVSYQSLADTLGCHSTVLPAVGKCDTLEDKAIYREFVVGDANGDGKADSGIVSISGFNQYNYQGYQLGYFLLKGDAAALAAAQNAFAFPDSIKGLTPYSDCSKWWVDGCTATTKFCVVPGTYTFATLGNPYTLGAGDQPSVTLNLLKTLHKSPANAQNMGNIVDSAKVYGNVYSDVDYFSCFDNAVTINGFAPPDAGGFGHPATKAIYRQFYLKSTSLVSIQEVGLDCGYPPGVFTLFSGQASAGIGSLVPVAENGHYWGTYLATPACNPLPPGWYTVVSYGNGPTYTNPLQNLRQSTGYGGDVGFGNQFYITVTQSCPAPKYDRPHKACIDTVTKKPFLLQWAVASGGAAAAYPVTDTTYALYTENFNCQTDTPFSKQHIKPCDPSVDRVVYYVFRIQKESYLQINTQGLWGEVYAADVRLDSAQFASLTPVQPCLQSSGYIELCRLQPGTYTLVVFASDANVSNGCGNVTPTIYIDKTGYARFDYAQKAYDFAVVPPDSLYHYGRVGDVNPLNAGRKPSNDFFYCTTGSAKHDPSEAACSDNYNPYIYKKALNNHLYDQNNPPQPWNIERRNLWYTFVINKSGWVHVKVENKSPDKTYQYPFAVYKSDVNGNLPFSKVVSTGQVDSTELQGLSLVDDNLNHNTYYWCWTTPNEISFYRDPCLPQVAARYYVLVDNTNSYPYTLPGMQVNSQVEVSILLDTVNAIRTKFDHYYKAYNLGSNLGGGVDTGAVDNFSCATSDATDPVLQQTNCAPKTLWYKFTTKITGSIRFISLVNGALTNYQGNDMYLYRQTVPGDSTSAGMELQNAISLYDPATNAYWGENCITPGAYYLVITGCNRSNENFQPVVSLNAVATKFDHNYQTSNIGNNLGAGVDTGALSNFCCATSDATDPVLQQYSCAPKTLWYKFSCSITGNVVLSSIVNGNPTPFQGNDLFLYREVAPGDSTSTGFQYVPSGCVSPGTYYIMVTGCGRNIESFQPVITLTEDPGDFCSAPVVAQLTGAGSTVASVVVDCHTIGTDYGEFGPTLSCPVNAATGKYKSSWFRVDISGKDTLDITAFLNERTSDPNTADIQYRLMTGDCNAMQETSCVEDALTHNTYKCLPAGSYYIQVFTPIMYNGSNVTGSIDLHISAVKHADTCAPIQSCLATANFVPQFNCNAGNAVNFTNYSTYGNAVVNKWYFGYKGDTSLNVAPSYVYPALAHDTTYNATLVVTNSQCNKSDTVTKTVTIPARPYVNLGPDIAACKSDTNIVLNATSFAGATYTWQDGSTNPTYAVAGGQYQQYFVTVAYNNCTSSDTVNVFINTVQKNPLQTFTACTGDWVNLAAGTYPGLTINGMYQTVVYYWNTGATNASIYAKTSGTYWVDKSLNSCTIRDSFLVTGGNVPPHPLGPDTAVCLLNPYILNATISNATGYSWQDGSTSPQYSVTLPGLYWVDIFVGSCTFRDSITIKPGKAATPVITGDTTFCKGDSARLDAGTGYVKYLWNNNDTTEAIFVKTPGLYKVTGYDAGGCNAVAKAVKVVQNTVAVPVITGNKNLCYNDSLLLDAGAGYAKYAWNTGDSTQTTKVKAPGVVEVTVQGANKCSAADSVIITQSPPAVLSNITAAICAGKLYTLPSGKTESNRGVYQDTLLNTGGCDSLVTTLTLSVDTTAFVDTSATICAGQTYTLPSGKVVKKAGVYSDTLRYLVGCDSIITTARLTVLGKKTIDTSVTICAGQLYTLPSGTAVGTQGIYHDTLHYAITGCDSVVTNVNLTVLGVTTVDTSATICMQSVYTLPSGKTVGVAGLYSDTLRYVAGCDSLITTLTLSVDTAAFVDTSATICAGQTYTLPSGRVVKKAGVYGDTLHYVVGCDSVITKVRLTVLGKETVDTSVTICAGQLYTLPSGTAVGTQGIYHDTLHYAITGCDSVVTNVNLTVLGVTTVDTSATICMQSVYTLPSGKTVGVAGLYSDTLRYVAGCDSLITMLNLSVDTTVFVNTSATICAGQTYTLPSGRVVKKAGVYSDALRYVVGCDSVITKVRLTVLGKETVDTSVTICAGQLYTLPSGTPVSAQGIYHDTLHYAINGCDSVVTNVNLTVLGVATVYTSATICAGQYYTLPSGRRVNTAGIYNDTMLYAASGCDSLVTTANLTVLGVKTVDTSVTICTGQTYTLPSGKIIKTAGSYHDTARYTPSGCDSLLSVVALAVSPPLTTAVTAAICTGNSYTLPGGQQVTAAGAYIDTLRTTGGCDSIITTTLAVTTLPPTNVNVVICSGQTYTLPTGLAVGSAGVYVDTLKTAGGCDSIIVTNITLLQAAIKTQAAFICAGDVYTLPWGGQATLAGVYSDTLRTASGCDSLINNVNLAIKPLPVVGISKSNDVDCVIGTSKLMASGGISYVWQPDSSLSNANIYNPVAAPTQTTTYYVTASGSNGCIAVDSITVQVMADQAVNGFQLPSAFTPNGDGYNDCFGVKTWGTVTELNFSVFDRFGVLLFNTRNPALCWDGTYKGIAQPPGTYVFMVTAQTICGKVFRKGTVVLIR